MTALEDRHRLGNGMADQNMRFDDGASYERMMGIWSRSAGEKFLDWLAPPSGLRWIDVGCGNGAFTALLFERCSPAEVQGIDPSEAQLAFARTRPGSRLAAFHQADAMALPFADNSFDAAVMALVIVFVPDPAKGVSEMVRVVVPGGAVVTYMWDMWGGRSPLDPIHAEIQAMNIVPTRPPRMDASRIGALRDLWVDAGLEDVETREIAVQRTYASFDDFWTTNLQSPAVRPTVSAMTPEDVEMLISRVRARLPMDADGRITYSAHAHAVRGRRPQ